MLGSAAQSSQSHWGVSDGIAYIPTTPLLQGKPVSEPGSSVTQPRSPFEAAAVQHQPPDSNGNHKSNHVRSQSQPQLPMIMEQNHNQSASPSDTAHFSSETPPTSRCSSPSASTAANASSTDLRAFPDGSVDGPLHLQPITPHYPVPGSTPFSGLHSSLASSSHQPADYKLGTGGLNKSRYRGVSYDKKKRKWRVQIKVLHCFKTVCKGCFC